MAPKNEAPPKGKGKETEWRIWPQEEVGSSHQSQSDVANISASRDADDGHQIEKQVSGRKREAAEVAPDDKVPQKAMKFHDPVTWDLPIDANSLPPFLRPKNEPNVGQRGEVAKLSPYGSGYFVKLDPLACQGQDLQKLIMNQMAQENSTGEVVSSTAPAIEQSRGSRLKEAIEGIKYDESQVRKCSIPRLSEKQKPAQTQPVSQPRQPAIPPPQLVNEETAQSSGDEDEAAADTAQEAPSAHSYAGSESYRYPEWQDLLEFMELTKSRLLENERVLEFLRSLEPRIIDDSDWSYQIHTLFLSLARMANISQRRERFEEYLVEAAREWHCLTTVYKYGCEDENALASEENCECPQKQKPCLQVRIRRGKLGAFDVRFR